MSWTTTINGVSYTAPDVGENFWGTQVKNWMQAVGGTGSGQGGMLKKDGGLFQLLAEVNFGTAFGIKSLTYTSGSAASGSAAASGVLRLKRADIIGWRNNADSGNLTLGVSTSNWIQWQSVDLADISSAQTFTNKSISGLTNTISNIAISSIVAPAAGVIYSDGASILSETRLSLSRTAAGTQYYLLTGNGASSPSYALLTNNSVDAAAAIARNKLASGTADHVLINDGSGVISSEAQLSITRGGTGLSSVGTSNQVLGVNNAGNANEYKTFSIGTAGSDFAIAHSAGSVVFNLPDASAATRGALTSTDWSTFNSKIGGSGTNGQVALFSGTSTVTSNAAIAYSTSANSNTLSLLSGIKIGTNTTVAASAGAGAIRYNAGTLEFSDGAAWNTLGVVGAGIVSLNALTVTTQTFAVGTAGTDFAISSATSTHTFNLPDAGASARGVVTTGTQTFAGAKTFSSNATFSSYVTAGDIISRNNSDGSVSNSSGQTLWHPNLNIQSGHVYTIAGEMLTNDDITGDGSIEGDGLVTDTSTDLTGYAKLSSNQSFTGGNTFNERIEALGGIYSVGITNFGSNILFKKSGETVFSADTSDGADNKRIVFCGGGANGASRGASLELAGNENGDAGAFYAVSGTGAAITLAPAGTPALTLASTGAATFAGNIILPSGGGIDFSANSSAAGMTSEILSDYEEGTWTPGFAFGGGTTGITYNASTGGRYTKIGDTVFCNGYLKLTNKGSSAGALNLTGLPFTIRNSATTYASVNITYHIQFSGLTAGLYGYGTVNSTSITLLTGGAVSVAAITESNCTNDSELMISFHYKV